jgi:hypothetical protein
MGREGVKMRGYKTIEQARSQAQSVGGIVVQLGDGTYVAIGQTIARGGETDRRDRMVYGASEDCWESEIDHVAFA